jgi:hypothetical protein
MSHSHINSSFSDDGISNNRSANSPLGRRSEEGKVYSTQVEYSDKGKGNYFYEERISE